MSASRFEVIEAAHWVKSKLALEGELRGAIATGKSGSYADLWKADDYAIKSFKAEYSIHDAQLDYDPLVLLTNLEGAESFFPRAYALGWFVDDDDVRHPAVVEDMVDGLTLEAVCDRGMLSSSGTVGEPVPVRTAAAIALELAKAVRLMGECDVAHRDLSPKNVMLLRDFTKGKRGASGSIRIIDLGQSTRTTRDTATPAGQKQRFGTIPYAAPEMFAGQNYGLRNKTATDVWSLGALIVRMLAGEWMPPELRGVSIDCNAQNDRDRIAESKRKPLELEEILHEHNLNVPEGIQLLTDLVRSCTSYTPETRIPVDSVVTALERFLFGKSEAKESISADTPTCIPPKPDPAPSPKPGPAPDPVPQQKPDPVPDPAPKPGQSSDSKSKPKPKHRPNPQRARSLRRSKDASQRQTKKRSAIVIASLCSLVVLALVAIAVGVFWFYPHIWFEGIVESASSSSGTVIKALKNDLNENSHVLNPIMLYKINDDRAEAQYMLGWIYDNGWKTVEEDDAKAVEYYRQAADQGLAEAQNRLGVMYADGEGGLEEDDTKAVELYRQAAGQGYDWAQYNLANCYYYGRGELEESKVSAARLYRLAADQGLAEAENMLGVMYNNGEGGLEANYFEAVELFSQAANQGYHCAQCNLGYYYEYGLGGLEVDTDFAKRLYELAAEQGNEAAQEALKRLGSS